MALAVLLDMLLGEPRRLHPLVGFGNIAGWVDSHLFRLDLLKPAATEPCDATWDVSAQINQRLIGIVAVTVTVAPFVLATHWLASINGAMQLTTGLILLYLSIGSRSLFEHAARVEQALTVGDLDEARHRVGMIVSRDTSQLSEADVSRATIESVLENGSDAIFGALFWFMLLGPAGAVLFRLSNTLDAMWGYKTEKYLHYGWAAARFDDLLCWLPSRLTALTYALAGNYKLALTCWRQQAKTWYSPNAGPVMSAGAGSLEVALGGAATYHGILKERPVLGCGSAPIASDIGRAIRLVQKALVLWILAILFLTVRP